MSEYIEREALIEEIKERNRNTCNGSMSCLQMKRMVEKVPAADVAPVVRCRECKHYMEHRTRRHGQLIYTCLRMAKYELAYHVCPDDFCSYGERKDDDEF